MKIRRIFALKQYRNSFADKSIHIDEYYDDVIAHAKEAFEFQTRKVGAAGAYIIRSYAFAKSLAWLYKKMPFLVKILHVLGAIIGR